MEKTTDIRRFVRVMEKLATHFPGRKIDPDLCSAYFNELESFPITDIENAAKEHIATGKKFPFVSDLLIFLRT